MAGLQTLDYVLGIHVEKLRDELYQLASQRMVSTPNGEEYGKVQATIEVDLDAVLRAETGARIIRQVQPEQSEEDNPPAEEAP